MTADVSGLAKAAWRSAMRWAGVPAKKCGPRARVFIPTEGVKPRAVRLARPLSMRGCFAEDAGAMTEMAAVEETADG
jgi:hypothetical protein